MENLDDPEKFETYVRFLYEALLNLHGEGVQGHGPCAQRKLVRNRCLLPVRSRGHNASGRLRVHEMEEGGRS